MTEAENRALEGTILLTITPSLWFPKNEVLQIDSRTGNPSTFFVASMSQNKLTLGYHGLFPAWGTFFSEIFLV